MADIKLTPELLSSQSTEMTSLKSEFDALFTQVKSTMSTMNDSWSENLAKNFEGKISGAQKNFSSILNMLANGSSAAQVAAQSFSDGSSINSVLAGLLGTTDGSAFDSVSSLAEYLTGTNLSDEAASFVAEQLGGNVSAETIKQAAEQIMNGDYEGALKTAGQEVVNQLISDEVMGSVDGTWVGALDTLTGGSMSLSTLGDDYKDNLVSGVAGNLSDLAEQITSGDATVASVSKTLGEAAWNATAGSVIDTAMDHAYNLGDKLTGGYYSEQGATDAESAIGVMCGDIAYAMTGDSSDREYAQNYYSEHGGIASGIVDGVAEIGSYVGEQLSNAIANFDWHSLMC